MDGLSILAQTLSVPAPTRTRNPEMWQYHSRGGRHSITSWWGVLFDLLRHSALLRYHVETGKVVFGLDHKMHDYAANRSKNLDLVIARPHEEGWTKRRSPRVFSELPALNDMHLDAIPGLAELPIQSRALLVPCISRSRRRRA